MLEARGVTVRRGPATLLDAVSLDIRPGEVLGLVGPNGAGKSTLLRVLAGIEPLAAGTVTLDGEDLKHLPATARARRIAYLPQTGRIEWAIPVRALVALGRLPHGDGTAATGRAAIEAAMVEAEIADLASRAVTTLSGGERARALAARAFAGEPEILLADEPTVALDPRHQLRLMAALRQRAATGTALVVVLHELGLATRFCDRLALMAGGKVVAEGPPGAVLTDETLAAVYGVTAVRLGIGGEIAVMPWKAV
jgi:iron complex transport system ATP-binding protein